MFECGLERVVLGAATVLWLAQTWYLSRQLVNAREELERVLEQFPGIRESLRRNQARSGIPDEAVPTRSSEDYCSRESRAARPWTE